MVVSITAFRDLAAGETLLNSVSGIDATAAATTNLYTVPGGQTVVVTKVVLRVENINTLTVNPVGGVGIAAGEDDIFFPQTVTGLTAIGDTWTFDSAAKAVDAAGAEIIKLGLDTLATATTLTLAADIFGYFVGTTPASQAIGSWASFTPTGSWSTNTTYAGHYRVVGDELQVRMLIDLAGAPDATALTLNLPSGFSVDTAKFAGTGSYWPVGQATLSDAGTGQVLGRIHYDDSAAVVRVVHGASLNGVTETTPFTWAVGDQVFIEFSVPVA